MNEVRIIKRYANRKLYDTQHSRYVTLEQISEMIRNGDDVKIIDNKTKEDLTSVTLAQIIFEEEKKQRSFLPLQAMRNIIQNGGESFAQFVTEAQRRVTSILPRRKDDEERHKDNEERRKDDDEHVASHPAGTAGAAGAADRDAGTEQTSASKVNDIMHPLAPGSDDGAQPRRPRPGLLEFREWIQQSQRTIEEWQKRVDDRIRNVAEGISPFAGVHKELQLLASRIGELEAKLAQVGESEWRAAAAKDATRPVSTQGSNSGAGVGAGDGAGAGAGAGQASTPTDGRPVDHHSVEMGPEPSPDNNAS